MEKSKRIIQILEGRKGLLECWHDINEDIQSEILEQIDTVINSQPKTEWISVEYKMSDKKFCELKTAYTGEKIDNIKQLVKSCFSGEELKEFLEFVINQVTKKE